MKLGELSLPAIRRQLASDGLTLQIGPFSFRLLSLIDLIAEGLSTLYSDYSVLDNSHFVDYEVRIIRQEGLRGWLKPQAVFEFDGIQPFVPLPLDHAFPLLEWAMNWCISIHAHHFLLLHSAVIEREGCAVIMPAPPGSGKSTLCAALVHRGWRLLSDELALISLEDASITPLGRPVSLKNRSIDVIRDFVPGATFNRITHETSKGSVTHLKVPTEHVRRIEEVASPRWVVFPKYVPGSEPKMAPRSSADSMLNLARNSFNYMVLGRTGFEVLSKVIDASDCYDFEYSQLDDAIVAFEQLLDTRKG